MGPRVTTVPDVGTISALAAVAVAVPVEDVLPVPEAVPVVAGAVPVPVFEVVDDCVFVLVDAFETCLAIS